jgi:type IV pilus assembly protein PilX
MIREKGAALVISLVMLAVVMLLGISAADIALEGEKSSRNDRDRQIAFQAAEAGLLDAELDIEHSPDAAKSRSQLFSSHSMLGFPGDMETGCGSGDNNMYLGLCKHAPDGMLPVWQTVDFSNASVSRNGAVPYGRFTGQTMQTGKGVMPAQPPRYVIEIMPYNKEGESADQVTYFYRITAVGFGVHDTTQVALQTFYRKED